tara:strand:+ start:683 stop:1009 length:327 start_codon:yes stop_codon:yes gene_type:complete
MIIDNHNNILKIKPNNKNFIQSFNIDLFQTKYKNHDVILLIDFIIDPNLIDFINNWTKILKKKCNYLIVVVDLIDEYLLNNKSIIFVPTLKEAIDFIELEKINKDLRL